MAVKGRDVGGLGSASVMHVFVLYICAMGSAHAATPVWLLALHSKPFFSHPCAYNRIFSI